MILTVAMAALLGVQAATGTVSGQIQSSDGRPASGVRIAAMVAVEAEGLSTGTLMTFTLSDDSGRYKLEGIPPGRYFIAAGLIGLFTYHPGTTEISRALPVDVTTGSKLEDLNFQLARLAGTSIRGTITNLPAKMTPLAAALLRVTLTSPALSARGANTGLVSAIAADGSFGFHGIPPGVYTLRSSAGIPPVSVTLGASDVDGITLRAPAILTGQVDVEGGGSLPVSPFIAGNGPSLITVRFKLRDVSAAATTPVATDGTFAVALPVATDYTVSLSSLPFGYYVKSIAVGATDLRNGLLSIDESFRSSDIRVTLTKERPSSEPPGVRVAGRVTIMDERPLASVELRLSTVTAPAVYEQQVPLKGDGSFEILGVSPGAYTANLYAQDRTMPAGFVARPINVGNTDIENVDLTVSRSVTLRGKIQFETGGGPVPPTMLAEFTRSDGRKAAASPKPDGTFSVVLPEGNYKVTVSGLSLRYLVSAITAGSRNVMNALSVEPTNASGEVIITLLDLQGPR